MHYRGKTIRNIKSAFPFREIIRYVFCPVNSSNYLQEKHFLRILHLSCFILNFYLFVCYTAYYSA